MKYIDPDKMIAEIERFSATEYGGNTFGDDVANGALDYVLKEIIPSLQQESESICNCDWIPSGEQIKALQMVKDSHCFMYQKDRVAIEKLLEQLKSL